MENLLYLCSPFPLTGKECTLHIDHKPYYQDRLTTWDLCHDFPEDEMYIDGLHAMQCHFYSHNVPVEIPVVRVMNAAHFLLAYVFQTTCSDNQSEYDVLAYGSVGHDKKVMLLTLIVLAAMLKRTEGFRARMCRNMLLEDRSEDFYDGVSLYDQFLSSEEKHFAEEDFLIDTHNQIAQLQEENTRLISENITLKHTITTMEKESRPQTVINVAGNYIAEMTINNDIHDNPNSIIYTIDPGTSTAKPENTVAPSTIPPGFFRVTDRFSEANIRERLEAELNQSTSKIDFCRALYRLQHMGCINIDQYASDAQRAKVLNSFQSKYELSASDFCRARQNR